MAEPLLRIAARWDIREGYEDNQSPMTGRAYLSACNLQGAYESDLRYAIERLEEVMSIPHMDHVRDRGFEHVIALMWGKELDGGRVVDMVDFFGWKYGEWKENGEISAWQTREGRFIIPDHGISEVTCEGGEGILNSEVKHRRARVERFFRDYGPKIMGLDPSYDFCSPDGMEVLKKLLERDSLIIESPWIRRQDKPEMTG